MDTREILSPVVAAAVQIAVRSGNEVSTLSTRWSKVAQVIHMKRPLDSTVRRTIQEKFPTLRYWATDPTPHNAAEEGFTCDESRVAVTFPREAH
jgi:hypothetical protein